MDRVVFAAIADDDTGASDLAGMLAGQDVRTLLVIDLPTHAQFMEWSEGYQAIVMAEGTRNLSTALAHERTSEAIRIVKARDPRIFQIKYCSTFDSTSEGNIGTSLDAALDSLDEDFTIAVPALPVNGRTTYRGYHFVHDQLLSDSSMREHPLTPMTNPNLVDLLGKQTKRRVGLASYGDVEAGALQLKQRFQSLRDEGIAIAIVDCLNDKHVETICRAAADFRLISGGSAFGIKMPAVWRERGWMTDHSANHVPRYAAENAFGCLLIAGSCSVATRGQNEWLAAQGVYVKNIEPRELLTGSFNNAALVSQVSKHLAAKRHCLLTTTSAPAEVQRMQEWGAQQGLTIPSLGEALANALAELTLQTLQNQTIGGLIIAGGETSGAVCRRLNLGAFHVGQNIEPGVPLCFSRGRFQLPVVLKSGNFGSRDFYGKALQAITHPAKYLA